LRDRIRVWEKRQSPAGDEVWLNWTVRQKLEGSVVGYVQASARETGADLAWVSGSPFQRRSYATEAMRAVVTWLQSHGVMELRANIHPQHTASQRIAEHIGLHLSTQTTKEAEQIWISNL
jgi:RimJ/RimL family protein N-acetyltransferase